MKKYYEHKQHRLKNYNYSNNGSYFITICVKNKECLLGDIVAVDDPIDRHHQNINDLLYQKATTAKMILSDHGKIIDKYIKSTPFAYNNLKIDNYVIMPNHIHLIISISSEQEILTSPQYAIIPKYIRAFKRLITNELGFSIFQRNYHDHIIRDEKEYEKIWDYIDTNESNWVKDRFYML